MSEDISVIRKLLEQHFAKAAPTPRVQVEAEVEADLQKNYRHLLVDVHEELLHWDWPVGERQIHAQKRLASLLVKSAEAGDRQQEAMTRLTVSLETLTKKIFWFTVASVLIGLASLSISFYSLSQFP